MLSIDELENMNIVGFPKLLRLYKYNINENIKRKFQDKLNYLIDKNLLNEKELYYELTQTGKNFIDNIYYFLIDSKEKDIIKNQVKILALK